MRIIISPAKKMKVDSDSLPHRDLPQFLPQAEQVCKTLQGMSAQALQKLWKCNDQIADLNIRRLQSMDLYHGLTPAVLAYEGIQYRYMAPGVFTDSEFAYIQEHLRILSGFYGLLRPLDGIVPYRLEMQAKLNIGPAKDLCGFWQDRLAQALFQETNCILNLASKEYSGCISRYLPESVRFITCIFGQQIQGKIIEKGTMCKMARGEMVRFLAQHQVTDPEGVKAFHRLNYTFAPEYSTEDTYVFLQDCQGQQERQP